MTKTKSLPIGIEFYKEMIDRNYYYVDKTWMIYDLLKQGNKVTLFTRPRRFGKTLALSMLQTFFEKEIDTDGNVVDNSRYFIGKKIMDAGEAYAKHQGQHPVIFLSLKSAKQPNFEMAYKSLLEEIQKEYERHRYVLRSEKLSDELKKKYLTVLKMTADDITYAKSLEFLSRCLKICHGRKVILLLDEYDVPLENAYFNGFYDEMIAFIRSLFESTLKTNETLELAVITGCLRISRESIFTGLNNLKVISVLNKSYAEYFGFVQNEVDELLDFYNLQNKHDEVKEWYDGYLFGKTEVYNPWSLLNYISDMCFGDSDFPKPYWSNTSSNSIIRKLVEGADRTAKRELELLIAGETIEKPVHEDITYEDIYRSQENLWNFLFFTGYLKSVGQHMEQRTIYLTLKIPNEEILYIYENVIREWFQEQIKTMDFSNFYHALFEGDVETMEKFLKKQLHNTISLMDVAENFYHGFLLGMLSGLQEHDISSNRESGDGRPDIVIRPDDTAEPAVILELKRTKEYGQMERYSTEALAQIEAKNYDEELLLEGYSHILKYGICFCRKNCTIKVEK